MFRCSYHGGVREHRGEIVAQVIPVHLSVRGVDVELCHLSCPATTAPVAAMATVRALSTIVVLTSYPENTMFQRVAAEL